MRQQCEMQEACTSKTKLWTQKIIHMQAVQHADRQEVGDDIGELAKQQLQQW